MADAVSTVVLDNGPRNYVAVFTNNSDATGESNVTKVTTGTLGTATSAKVRRIIYNVTGGSVIIAWKATTNNPIAVLSGYGEINLKDTPGITNPATTGNTGDITFTTKTFVAASGYTIILEIVKGGSN